MSIKDKLQKFLGIGTKRQLPPPSYHLVTDGLVVTATKSEAWFSLGTSNTDESSSDALDDELWRVIKAVSPLLQGLECHLKVVWGSIDGDAYLSRLGRPVTEWDKVRADWLDDYVVRTRQILLGVTIDSDRASQARASAARRAAEALGLPTPDVSSKELAWAHGRARALGQALQGTPWQVSLAPVELLAWAIKRELHRDLDLPSAGTIQGSSIMRLTSGKTIPYPDHLRCLSGTGDVTAHVSVITLAEYPEDIDTNGAQAWLRDLAAISRVDYDGEVREVNADASIRFRILPAIEGEKMVDDTRALAKEQRQSASKQATGDTTADIEETEQVMEEARRDIRRDGLRLVQWHPRIVVWEETLDELRASTQAVITHFAELGITACVAHDEQRELWLEQMPGDILRVADMGQTGDATAFFGGWWWGGSAVGEGETSPMVATLTGSTPGLARHSLLAGSKRGDATTTVYVGRSGRGKTTAIMLETMDALADGTCVTWISTKGDDLSLAELAREYGHEAEVITLSGLNAGVADLFRSLPADEAVSQITSTLGILTPPHLRHVVPTHVLELVTREAGRPQPSTWNVLQQMRVHDDKDVQVLGQTLINWAKTRLGAPVLGRPVDGAEALRNKAGLWIMHLQGFELPANSDAHESPNENHRLSVVLLRAITLHSLHMSASPALRMMPKLIVIPEAHRLLGCQDGVEFIDYTARVGRASNTCIALDSQDTSQLVAHPGIVEQISTLVVFQLTSPEQVDGAVALLELTPGTESRNSIVGLATNHADPDQIRKGHAFMRDFKGRVATVQYVIPSKDVEIMLSTNYDADQHRADRRRELDLIEVA